MKIALLLLLSQLSLSLAAEKVPTLKKIINSNLEPSYLTFGNGIDLQAPNAKKWSIFRSSLYEGQINLHLAGFENLNYKGWDFMTKITGKFLVRQTTEKSAPVKTPGYLPRITFYFWKNGPKRIEKPNYWSFRLSHHSNGQGGNFYNSNGSINTTTGNFSTNYLELASYNLFGLKELSDWTRLGWTKLSLTWHPGFNRDKNLDGQYEKLKVELSFRSKSYKPFRNSKNEVKFFSKVGYIISGKEYIVAPIDQSIEGNALVANVISKRARWYDRIQFEARALLSMPKYFQSTNLFIKYDVGYDYYNIQFRNRIHKIQFGLIGNPFGFFSTNDNPGLD